MFYSIQTFFIKKKTESLESSYEVDFKGTKIGVLFNSDVSEKHQLQQLIQDNFEVDASEINFLGFSRKNYNKIIKPDFVFEKKDFTLLGQPKSEVITEFLNHNYKLLFNFFGKNEFYLETVAQQAKSKLKVGLSGSNEKVNDLLLALDSKDLSFFEVSSKYIKQII